MPRIVDAKKPKAILQASELLDAGELVVFPTDTVYGLAARPDRPKAIERLFHTKGRSNEVPIAVLVRDVQQASSIANFSERALKLTEKFWPGSLTIVVSRAADFEADIGGDGDTVGVRAPDHPVAQDLLRLSGPLVTTSANRSGEATPETVDAIAAIFGDSVSLYLDAGSAHAEGPSTVVAINGALILIREGILGIDAIERALEE